ncbi:RES family NAD+ phosphorylase [Clostridium lundense]|uniref:RES family NAD+ phosphorylase n=1 Tax=Clostridium lundense TaxID=319475 RepID=UPI0004884A94|nr:RES family NAD+ phosphorylase [Clostridium lundense]
MKPSLFECTRKNELVDVWNDFCNELMHTNRFFTNFQSKNIQTTICFNLILSAIDYMVNNCEYYVDRKNILHRARLFNYGKEYSTNEVAINMSNGIIGFHPNDMKSPPYDKTKQGRINPEGISYLYTCDCVETCIAELKPYINSYISIIDIKPKKRLKVFSVDSIDYKKAGLEGNIFIDFLKTKFIQPYKTEEGLEYIPTQFIAEYIKNKECDGIKHPSSVSHIGNNVIIFDENKVEFGKTTDLYHINEITYKKTEVKSNISINKGI